MKSVFLIITFFCSLLSLGQAKIKFTLIDKKMDAIPSSFSNSTDSIAKYINENFNTDNEKIRAAFYWTASNISYDVDNMFEININETSQERIAKTLKTKTGICIDYANVFNNIVNAVGIKSVIISGYTKINDRVNVLSHAWCAAYVDNTWCLFDPTWGSGYVNNTDRKYIRNINNSFYKMTPEIMINSHMPFDYLWQFLNYPVTNKEFIEGVVAADETKEKFDFIKEIARLESLSKKDMYLESSQRIKKNGMKNQMISQAYVNAMNNLNYETNNENRNRFNEIINQKNLATSQLNEFVQYRNRQFQPALPDDELKRRIQEPRDKLAKCMEDIVDFEKIINASNQANVESFKKNTSQTLEKAEEYLQFVNLYLSKPKPVRKTMFYSPVKTQKKIN